MSAEISGETMQIAVPDSNFFTKIYSLQQQATDSLRLISAAGNNRFKCLSSKGTKRLICEQNVKPETVLGLCSESDLMPGVYEGGFKVWECSHDLLQFVDTNVHIANCNAVLEIGCGSGLLGIHSLLNGAETVHFQDFNGDVLKWFTMPNIALNLNCEPGEVRDIIDNKCKFFAGDWKLVNKEMLAKSLKYDFIFTSETIYNTDNHSSLLQLIKDCLSEKGVAFVAAKSYYFGVGGGILDFQQFVENDPQLECSVCQTIETSVPRVIIKLQLKQ